MGEVRQGRQKLPGYQAQPGDSGVDHSKRKLADGVSDLKPFLHDHDHVEPIMYSCQTEDETWAYRCRCSFQLVTNDAHGTVDYAMREQKQPIPLGSDFFPIATLRIQRAMKDLLEKILNASSSSFVAMKRNVTSVTFSSAWNDVPESDCIVTLHYDKPLDQENWKTEASIACDMLDLRQLNGRSRKCLVSAKDEEKCQSIRDRLWLYRLPTNDAWRVTLNPVNSRELIKDVISVQYEKPHTAFYHPNARAMTQSLEWLLSRLSLIVRDSPSSRRPSLLEMYCGCGAHTMPLLMSGLLEEIVAVELDVRLVDALRNNVFINKAAADDGHEQIQRTPLKLVQGDAGDWAKRVTNNQFNKHDILLVDPPRNGLDEKVCQLAVAVESLQHLLYVSCGRQALLRDLERLSPAFKVVDCALVDLFPRLDAIETLVHLQRRNFPK